MKVRLKSVAATTSERNGEEFRAHAGASLCEGTQDYGDGLVMGINDGMPHFWLYNGSLLKFMARRTAHLGSPVALKFCPTLWDPNP